MKKVLILSLLVFGFLMSSNNAHAQIKGILGVNSSKFTNTGSSEYKTGYNVGFSIMFDTKSKLYIEPGAIWFDKKGRIEDDFLGLDGSPRIQGVKVPVLFGIGLLGEDAPVNLRIFAGPAISFITGTKNNMGIEFKNSYWSADVGLGVDFLIFFIDLGYEFGLSNVVEGGANESKINTFNANLGVKFGF